VSCCHPALIYIRSGRASATILFNQGGCSCCGDWGMSICAADLFFMFPPLYIASDAMYLFLPITYPKR
jgi:hypothetical protein